MINALQGGSLFSSDRTTLLTTRIAERMYVDMRKKTGAVEEKYDAEIKALTAKSGTATGRAREAGNIQTAVNNGFKQVKEIRSILLEMRTLLDRAGRNTDSSDYYRDQFNERLKKINSIADKYTKTVNIVGHVNAETLEPPAKSLQVSDFAVDKTFQGPFVGTSFTITGTGANDGKSFENDPGAQLMQLVGDVGGDELGEESYLHNGGRIQNVSVTDDTITFDIDGTKEFTGTLKKGGLEIMPSWFYDDLSTADGVEAAKQAIRDADRMLVQASFELRTLKIEIDPVAERLNEEKKESIKAVTQKRAEKLDVVELIENNARREFNAVETSLDTSVGELDNYKRLLSRFNRGPFADLIA